MIADGIDICNLTVGDFNPTHFPIPSTLSQHIDQQVAAGQTNYPPCPSSEKPSPRFTTANWVSLSVRDRGGWQWCPHLCLLQVFCLQETPSHTRLQAGTTSTMPTSIKPRSYRGHPFLSNFMPTLEQLALLSETRVLHLNSPLNPCGTCIEESALETSAKPWSRRTRGGRPPGEVVDPPRDAGVLAAHLWRKARSPHRRLPRDRPVHHLCGRHFQGLCRNRSSRRMGGRPYLQGKFKALIGHMGAWAPRPVNLPRRSSCSMKKPCGLPSAFRQEIQARLDCIYQCFVAWRKTASRFFPVPPQGAIYLSVQCNLIGKSKPDGSGV